MHRGYVINNGSIRPYERQGPNFISFNSELEEDLLDPDQKLNSLVKNILTRHKNGSKNLLDLTFSDGMVGYLLRVRSSDTQGTQYAASEFGVLRDSGMQPNYSTVVFDSGKLSEFGIVDLTDMGHGIEFATEKFNPDYYFTKLAKINKVNNKGRDTEFVLENMLGKQTSIILPNGFQRGLF